MCLEGKFHDMSEEKIKNPRTVSFYFLVGPDSSISEDSSIIEYCIPGNISVRIIIAKIASKAHRYFNQLAIIG